MKKSIDYMSRWKVFGLICIVGLMLVGFTQALTRSSVSQLQGKPLQLDVPALKQSNGTSCGEAVIAMIYNYAYPNAPIAEAEVIKFATMNEYYTQNRSPYTSPANMAKIAKHYAEDISTGTVFNSAQGLALLIQELRSGDPVVLDVLSNFQDLESEAHFIVITGISIDTSRENAVLIQYNDPLTGTKETRNWSGSDGVWNAWQMNNDPGGQGWWLVISHT